MSPWSFYNFVRLTTIFFASLHENLRYAYWTHNLSLFSPGFVWLGHQRKWGSTQTPVQICRMERPWQWLDEWAALCARPKNIYWRWNYEASNLTSQSCVKAFNLYYMFDCPVQCLFDLVTRGNEGTNSSSKNSNKAAWTMKTELHCVTHQQTSNYKGEIMRKRMSKICVKDSTYWELLFFVLSIPHFCERNFILNVSETSNYLHVLALIQWL